MTGTSHRPSATQLITPFSAAKANASVRQQLTDATCRIQQASSVMALFAPAEIRRLRAEVHAVAAEEAGALVISRTLMSRTDSL